MHRLHQLELKNTLPRCKLSPHAAPTGVAAAVADCGRCLVFFIRHHHAVVPVPALPLPGFTYGPACPCISPVHSACVCCVTRGCNFPHPRHGDRTAGLPACRALQRGWVRALPNRPRTAAAYPLTLSLRLLLLLLSLSLSLLVLLLGILGCCWGLCGRYRGASSRALLPT
eukprot:scaffold86271_cov21-Tisochrysis_lutea.AAC.4